MSLLPTLQQIETARIELARQDFGAYVEYVHGFIPARHHREWIDVVQAPFGKKKHILVVAPPGSAKTSYFSQFLPMYLIGKQRNLHIGIVTHTFDRSAGLALTIRDTLSQSERYHKVFPGVVPDRLKGWEKNRWYVKRDRVDDKDPTMLAAGIEGNILGARFDYLIMDDAMDQETSMSETLRVRCRQWIRQTAMSRLLPKTGRAICVLCMTGDTPVTMADGTKRRLDTVRPGDAIVTWKDGKQAVRRVTNWALQGEDTIFELKTGNHTVRANGRHPLLVRRYKSAPTAKRTNYISGSKVEWVPIWSIRKGDEVVGIGEFSAPQHSRVLSDTQAWLLGFMFGDGWVTSWRKKSVPYVAKTPRRKKNHITEDKPVYHSTAYCVCAATSAYPSLDKKVLDTFRELFGKVPKLTKYGYVRLDSAEVARWFLSHGLTGDAHTKRLPDWLYSAPLETRLAFLSGFQDADGCIGGRNSDRVSILLCNKDLVEDLRHLARLCGFKSTNSHSFVGKGHPPHSPSPIEYEQHGVRWQTQRSSEKFAFYRVTSVEPAGRENVYDVEVEDTENFIADGLVSHNTRWNEEDLAAEFLKDPNWLVVHMPAIGYYGEGKALWQEWQPLDFLLEEKERDPYSFENIYQGNPHTPEGEILKRAYWTWAERSAFPVKWDRIIQAWDTASKKGEEHDYSVCVTFGLKDSLIYILDVFRGKLEFPQLVRRARDLFLSPGPGLPSPNTVVVEDASSGQQLAQSMMASQDPMIPVYASKRGTSDEISFVTTITSYVPNRVILPKGASWTYGFVEECAGFPKRKRNDQVMAFTHGMRYLVMRSGVTLDPKTVVAAPSQTVLSLNDAGIGVGGSVVGGNFGGGSDYGDIGGSAVVSGGCFFDQM